MIRSWLLTECSWPRVFLHKYSSGSVGSGTGALLWLGVSEHETAVLYGSSFTESPSELKVLLLLDWTKGKWGLFRIGAMEACRHIGKGIQWPILNKTPLWDLERLHQPGLTLTYTAILWCRGEHFILVAAATTAGSWMINKRPKAKAADSRLLIKNTLVLQRRL